MSMWKTILSHAVHVAAMYPASAPSYNNTKTDPLKVNEQQKKRLKLNDKVKVNGKMRVREKKKWKRKELEIAQ